MPLQHVEISFGSEREAHLFAAQFREQFAALYAAQITDDTQHPTDPLSYHIHKNTFTLLMLTSMFPQTQALAEAIVSDFNLTIHTADRPSNIIPFPEPAIMPTAAPLAAAR